MDVPEARGIEPDYCFYIDNWQTAVGKECIDWQADLPPDLVIEIDVTTYAAAEDYAPYRVPEMGLFKKSGLKIYSLQDNAYQEVASSRYFPDVDLVTLTEQVMQEASQQGTGATIRELPPKLCNLNLRLN
uniref:Putative restriction endonuclease domain-containing protein n=1 Tax=Oscillatoriales cyanobacterium SpSt-402 TaxID=2282168 RepID=A0A832M4G9_9CYAN